MEKIENIRTDYTMSTLNKSNLNACPMKQFEIWFNDIVDKILEPTAMTLSTFSDKYGCRSRVVLLKELRNDGFVFFTNYNSLKGQQIDSNNNVSLSFFWPNFQRQININGLALKLNNRISRLYFEKRPRGSQISAWASNQSEIIKSRNDLDSKYKNLEKKFKDQSIPTPPYWGGFLVQPLSIEFWQGGPNRMHDRFLYVKKNNSWVINRLSP